MQITIQRMTLDNFKCHRHLELDFGGRNAEIRGDNASGKSSILDAFTWLLFGKDSHGASNFEIKPLAPDGEVADHEAITAVECQLMADGNPITLRKTLKESWTSRRGTSTLVYTGNTMEYFVDEVPVRKTDFDKRVSDICSEDTFRLLTSVSYFSDTLPWQKRRAVLMDAFGGISDLEIMESNADLHPLLDALDGRSLEDCKKIWMARKKAIGATKSETPARLDELARQLADLRSIDFAAAEASLEAARAGREKAEAELAAIDNGTEINFAEADLRVAESERNTINIENETHKRSQRANGPDIAGMRRTLDSMNHNKHRIEDAIFRNERSLELCNKRLKEYREAWTLASNQVFLGGDCPTCGQPLPANMVADAMEKFERSKRKDMERIEAKAADEKANIAELESDISSAKDALDNSIAEIEQLTDCISNAAEPFVSDLPDYAERMAAANARIAALQDKLFELRSSTARIRQDIQARKAEFAASERAAMTILAQEPRIAQTETRMYDLRQAAKKATAELEDIETLLMLTDEFTRVKAKMLEDGINSNFRLASFRLFRTQANGGIEDRCDVTYNGVPYGSLNSGMKINVGIDIINTLSGLYGSTVPLFVDNAESVTALEPCLAQTIRLTVDEKYKEVTFNG